ncbi:delta-60 repeat domain-containing protein/Por secretion system C-terminal sorting domain-containing protein [Chryseobacterium taeanense]|uniref:Delta-60 repeat domain-containing protein/Por secretion system C-terminal sorting domain-containing protein n=1 Tax=Chryseobacterium taeanense TaxID=311334 RepID=A0A1G8JQB4_9FLAO|nr:T9SS type A sorting domain-containing protein [Chryseobacterium taeanense]SDI33479.1 delta-60 repeat domain-containing protein/Por secretion system C-terminal sorting domain-containing protein [Chryseobacterium taeanense]
MKKYYFLLLLAISYFTTAQTFSLDASFGESGYRKINSTTLSDAIMLPDGQFLTAYNSSSHININKINQNGAVDAAFGTKIIDIDSYSSIDESESVKKMVLHNNKIIMIGRANANPTYSLYNLFILRMNLDGTLDTTFGTNGFTKIPWGQYGTADDIVVDDTGNSYVLGYNMGNFILKFNANGIKDNSFGTNGSLALGSFDPRKLYRQNDGKFVLVGSKKNTSTNINESYIERRLADGTYDTAFGNNGSVIVPSNMNTVISNFEYDYANNTILLLHSASDGYDSVFLSKIQISDGAFVTGFSNGGRTPNYSFTNAPRLYMSQIKVLPNSKIVVIGNVSNFWTANINMQLILMRFNGNGTIDYSASSNGYQIFNTTPPSTGVKAEDIQRLFVLDEGSFVLSYSGSSGGVYGYSSYLTKFTGAFLGMNDTAVDRSQSSLILYPNPVGNTFTIQNKNKGNDSFEYRIFDVSGRIVQIGSSKFNAETNIQELQKGNYIIQTEAKGERQSLKFIKN